MILEINGNIKPYYVQTLAMIFFPGAKFPEGEVMDEGVISTAVNVEEREDGAFSSVKISDGERESYAEEFVKWNSTDTDRDREIKISVGSAFMKSGADFTGFTPPWGILTGVRPAKVATELLGRGMSEKEAAEHIAKNYFVTPHKASLAVSVSSAEARLITAEVRRECSVYIGIPFCPTRCAYCSFVSYTSPKLLRLIPEYLDALLHDIDGIFGIAKSLGMRVKTVYIGGGTPTVLSADQLEILLSKVREHAPILDEFTLEAGRPDTITKEKLRVAAKYSVDRISVNTQTLNDTVLEKIGRAHNSEMFFEAYKTARESGIKNINVDLIAGLPYDTVESFKDTVDRVIALDPENITVHTFSVKKSSELKSEGKYDVSSAVAHESVDYSEKALTANGYLPYYMYRQKNTVGNLENVGYAKAGTEGLYNIYMMEEIHSVFAAGASSVTKLVSLPDENGNVRIERFFEPKYPYEYLDRYREDGHGSKEELEKAAHEFFGK